MLAAQHSHASPTGVSLSHAAGATSTSATYGCVFGDSITLEPSSLIALLPMAFAGGLGQLTLPLPLPPEPLGIGFWLLAWIVDAPTGPYHLSNGLGLIVG